MLLSLLLFIVLIVVFYFLAKFIINYIPKKFHWVISLVLLGISLLLGYLIFTSIADDIKFHEEKRVRYAKVIDQLKIIRDAENAYKQGKGVYTADYNKLIHFIDNDSIAITQTVEDSRTETIRGVEQQVSFKRVDTLGYTRVFDKFKDIDYKHMMNVPSTTKKFDLQSKTITKGMSERQVPVFEAKVLKSDVLVGMKKKLIVQESTAIAMDEVRGKYISVGTLEDVKDSGNWPPMYDVEDED